MKSLYTLQSTAEYLAKVKSSNCYSYTKPVYIDDDGVEQNFIEDLLYPLNIKKEGRRPRYANINYEPASAECEFEVLNKAGKYSPENTTSGLNDVFKRDRKVRFYDGKYLTTPTTSTELQTLTSSNSYLYFAQLSSGKVQLDINNTAGGTNKYFQDIFTLYDSETYDDGTYTPEAYSIHTFDRDVLGADVITGFTIVSVTGDVDIYYRYNDSESATTSATWNYGGELSAGSNTITVSDGVAPRYIQVAFVFRTLSWSSGAEITSITINYNAYVEWVLLGEFLLDSPDYKELQSPKISRIKIKGRNAWKRALDSKINIEDLSGGVAIDQLIKDIADQIGLDYTGSSIPDLSSYGNRVLSTGYEDLVAPADIYKDIMQIIGKEYRMSVSDTNVLTVSARPVNYDVDFVFNFNNYIEAEKKEQDDRKIKRISIQSSKEVPNAVEELDTDTFTTSSGTLSWTSDSTGAGEAIGKYLTYTVNSGDIAISDIDMNNLSVDLTFTGSGSITVSVYGSRFNSPPDYLGEDVKTDNLLANDGHGFVETNPLIISDAEAKTISENFIAEFGNAKYNIKVQESYVNALLEVNDQVLIVSEAFLETRLYEILSIEHKIQSEVRKKSKFEIVDTGRDYTEQGDLVYDRNLYNGGDNLQYDKGFIYDGNYPVGVTAATINANDNRFVNEDF